MKYKLFQGRGGGEGNWSKKSRTGAALKLVTSAKELKWATKKSVRRYEILKEMTEKNLGFNESRIHAP